MVARLLFPDFVRRHSTGYHRYLAEVVGMKSKASDPAFRIRSTLRHAEEFSSRYNEDASKIFEKSVRTGTAASYAMSEGIRAFWKSWFEGMNETTKHLSAAFDPVSWKASRVVGHSEDGHVVEVRFGAWPFNSGLLARKKASEERKTSI